MLHKISRFVVSRFQADQKQLKEGSASKGGRKHSFSEGKKHQINVDFIDQTLHRLFDFRQNEGLLSSRIRFKIQDLIDEYNREWKQVIYGERELEDYDGFKYKYVPKEAIMSEDQISPNPHSFKRSRKASKNTEPTAYIYLKKSPHQPGSK